MRGHLKSVTSPSSFPIDLTDLFLANLESNKMKKSNWLCALAVLAALGATSTSAKADLIQYPGSTLTEAIGINNAGTVVGVYIDSSSVGHSFIYSSPTYTSFDDPSATAGTTQATGINNSGTVVGNYVSGGAYYGFERTPGARSPPSPTRVPTPPGHSRTGSMIPATSSANSP